MRIKALRSCTTVLPDCSHWHRSGYGPTPEVGVEGVLRLTALQRLEAQFEKLIPGPRTPMKSPQMKTVTINHKALNGILPSPTP